MAQKAERERESLRNPMTLIEERCDGGEENETLFILKFFRESSIIRVRLSRPIGERSAELISASPLPFPDDSDDDIVATVYQIVCLSIVMP